MLPDLTLRPVRRHAPSYDKFRGTEQEARMGSGCGNEGPLRVVSNCVPTEVIEVSDRDQRILNPLGNQIVA